MNNYRIMVADDHEIVRHGLRALLQAQPTWTICGEAEDGREAVAKALELKPDLVVLDIGMPNLNGLEATRQIRAALPATKVLILSLYESEQMVREVFEVGAAGYLLKSDASRYLAKAAESIKNGRVFVTPRFEHLFAEGNFRPTLQKQKSPTLVTLTARERQVIQLLGEGKTTKEVAVSLDMAVKTAETHRAHIMHKLDLHSITDLVMYAVRNRIVQLPQAIEEIIVEQSATPPAA